MRKKPTQVVFFQHTKKKLEATLEKATEKHVVKGTGEQNKRPQFHTQSSNRVRPSQPCLFPVRCGKRQERFLIGRRGNKNRRKEGGKTKKKITTAGKLAAFIMLRHFSMCSAVQRKS